MKWALSVVIGTLLLPSFSMAEEVNAGFVQGLWYSSEPVFAGVPTRIYVALRNNTEHDLTGTVRFTVDGKRVGSSDVRALSGRLVEAWVDWSPTEGNHSISAFVSDAQLHIIGEGAQTINVTGMVAEDSLSVERDTDKDGVGNSTDPDDDGDGVSDEDERARGTDPLRSDGENASREREEAPEEDERGDERQDERSANEERGLERYVSEGTTDELLGSMTAKIENSKEALDAYRAKRTERLDLQATSTEEILMSADTATITRTRIHSEQNLLSAFVSGVASILENIWTFVLWLASRALMFPALIELLLLLALLYGIYRTARWYGRRQY